METPFAPRPDPSLGTRLRAILQLTRPANAVTAAADTLAGIAVAWGIAPGGLGEDLWLLPLAALLLYAGGVTLNDVCDIHLDRQHRPERPLPRGHVSRQEALVLSTTLLGLGVYAAALHNGDAGLVAVIVAILVFSYNGYAKHRPWLGPINMGLCRAGSLLLGMAASFEGLAAGWPLAVIPLAYVAAITLVGRGESEGRNPFGMPVLSTFILVAVAYGFLALTRDQWPALLFVALYAILAWPPFIQAAEQPSPDSIRRAVKAGVLTLVVCDAALTAAFAGPISGLGVLLLLPLSRGLARIFPVA